MINDFLMHEREVHDLYDYLEVHHRKTDYLVAQIEQHLSICKVLEKRFAEVKVKMPKRERRAVGTLNSL